MIFIPSNDTEHNVMNIFNSETNENLGQIESIKSVNITGKYETDYVRKNAHKEFTYKHDPTYTLTFNTDEPIDTGEFYRVLGIDTSSMPDSYDIQFIKPIQARRHKKRRINKKWLKRYGYKPLVVDCKGWKLKCNTDGNVEFVKDI